MALSEQQAREQVQRMKGFIIKEAEEKRDELLAKANEECAIERQKLVVLEKKKIQAEYERKEKQAAVQKRIAYSNEYNGARLQALKAQDECVQALLEKARTRLGEIVADPARYKTLLSNYLVQALLILRDTEVEVRCRACDKALVKELLPDALKRFQAEYKKNVEKNNQQKGSDAVTDFEHDPILKPKITIGDEALPDSCGGGVVLASYNGRIICSNTIESRLAIAAEGCLPAIRKILFPVPIRKTPLANAQNL